MGASKVAAALRGGCVEFLAKWVGYESKSEMLWEPLAHFNEGAALLAKFEVAAAKARAGPSGTAPRHSPLLVKV